MMHDILSNPFTWGLALGLFCTALSLWRLISVKMDLARFRRHLSDRLELDADAAKKVKAELEALRRENEQLRIRVARFNDQPEWKAQRDLEIYARAEKQMLINVPGFAPAWESAKNTAHAELQQEDVGQSLPKRVFSRLFGSSGAKESLPGGE